MTNHIERRGAAREDDRARARHRRRHGHHAIDLQGRARCSRSRARCVPGALRVLGGVHATFMFKQVLQRSALGRRDRARRGRGNLRRISMRAIDEGRWPADRAQIKGLAFRDGDEIVATAGRRRRSRISTRSTPTGRCCEWEKYIYVPLGVRVAIPNMARGCPFTCSFCSQWKFWRDYRVRDPKKVVDEIEKLVNEHGVGFFILADEEPTINRKKFIRVLRGADRARPARQGEVGHQHPRHRHLSRPRTADVLPQGRARPCHRSAPRRRRS